MYLYSLQIKGDSNKQTKIYDLVNNALISSYYTDTNKLINKLQRF
jgi:hypothetical protein